MRLVIACAIFLVVVSCSSNEERKHTFSDQIRVSLDTVLVDSGDEFLYLQDHLYYSALSEDKTYLINFNPQDLIVEKIDLNHHKLEKRIQFEKEGPNGIGSNYPNFSILTDNNFLVWTYHFYKIFDQNNLLIKDMKLDKISAEYLGNTEYYPSALFLDEKDSNRVVGLIKHWETGVQFILDFDLESQTFEKIEVPELQKNLDYKIDLLQKGTPAGGYEAVMYWHQMDRKILISSSAFNEVQIVDMRIDSIYTKKWDSPLVGSKKPYLPPKAVERTSGEWKDILRKMDEEISYRGIVWDEKKQYYFRFSDRNHFGEDLNEYGGYVIKGADIFLSVFDENFNLVAEAQIPELSKPPLKYFTKDGDIWMYENIDDELAFIIMNVEVL